MRTSRAAIGVILALATLTACTSDDDGGDGFEVELLAGGDGSVPGPVRVLTAGPDESLWALAGDSSLVRIDSDGAAETTELRLPDGVNALADLAVAPDGTAYVLAELPDVGESSVYQVDGDQVVPAFGVPSDGGSDSAPDGTDAAGAALGPVADIAVDPEGRVLFVETHSPDGGVINSVQQVRRVDDDGTISTLAGTSEPGSGDDTGWFPEDGAEATSQSLAWPVFVSVAPSGDVYLRTGRSVLRVEDGGLTRVLGGDTSGLTTVPNTEQSAPFEDAVEALDAGYESVDDRSTFAAGDSGVLVGAPVVPAELSSDVRSAFSWTVEDAAGEAQAYADAVVDPDSQASRQSEAALYVSDGTVTTASVIGSVSTWLDDDTIATALVSSVASQETIVVTYDVPS
ncbi:NHL repeat-containing protein [Jiangella rhizosphaerae]|uniref:hypothetical protein n=1 Tax=Jiangella rhizosphaerae TaxID=2293569 RepID=UPI0013140117|nr:hypothetical protein [Jiangella rhizosphaerae]